MENNEGAATVTEPQEQECTAECAGADTIPGTAQKICVRFNKETRQLDLEQAAQLAQKGLKFDSISGRLERMKKLAGAENKSLDDFIRTLEERQRIKRKNELIEECNGNETAAQRIFELEQSESQKMPCGIDDLRSEFPNIKSADELPSEVVEAAQLKGSSLLLEYLKYENRRLKAAADEFKNRVVAQDTAIGSQKDCEPGASPVNAEFIRGLWG